MQMLPDFGERIGRDGKLVDEFLDALAAIAPEAGDDLIPLAMAICDARLGKVPDWTKALRKFHPKGARH